MAKVTEYSKKYTLVFGIWLLALMITAITTLGISTLFPKANAQESQKFNAKLSGGNEVPPVNTKASGDVMFELNAKGDQMNYIINIKGMNDVQMAHIHKGKAGENGPPIITLYMSSSTASKGNNLTITDKFISSQFEGSLQGKQMSDLLDLLKNKEAYVNVHSAQNPDGEIRGTIEQG